MNTIITGNNKLEHKKSYFNFLWSVFTTIKNKGFENFNMDDILVSQKDLSKEVIQKIQNTFLQKQAILYQKKEKLDKCLLRPEFLTFVLKSLGVQNSLENIKDIQLFQYNHILILKINLNDLLKLFFENTNALFTQIGFFVKNAKLGFDVLIVSDENQIDHEINESILELFVNEGLDKISLFRLNKLEKQYSKNELINGILRDIFSHLCAVESEQLFSQVGLYRQYVQYTMQIFPQYIEVLKSVNKILKGLLTIHMNEENIQRIILGSITNPKLLLEYIDDSGVLSTIFPNQYEIYTKNQIKSLFLCLNSCKLDVRFSKAVDQTCYETYETKDVKRNSSTETNEVKANINLFKNNFKEKLHLYFAKMQHNGIIKNVKGTFNPDSEIIISFYNGLSQVIRIDKQGELYFQYKSKINVKRTTVYEHEIKYKQRVWEDTRGVISTEKVSDEIKSVRNFYDRKVEHNQEMLNNIREWEQKVNSMDVKNLTYKDERNVVTGFIETENSYDLINTFININHQDSCFILSNYVNNLLAQNGVKTIIGQIGDDMKFIRQDGSIDELVIDIDGNVLFKINKIIKKEFKKTTTDIYNIHKKKYNIGDKHYENVDTRFLETKINIEFLNATDYQNQSDLQNKSKFENRFEDTKNQITNQQNADFDNITNQIDQSLFAVLNGITDDANQSILDGLNELILNSNDAAEQENYTTLTTAYESGVQLALSKLNQDIIKESAGEIDVEKLLYKESSREFHDYEKSFIQTIVYKRFFRHKGLQEYKEDYLLAKIEFNKETKQIKLHFDREGMCENHQSYSDRFNKYLEGLGMQFDPKKTEVGKRKQMYSHTDLEKLKTDNYTLLTNKR